MRENGCLANPIQVTKVDKITHQNNQEMVAC